MSDKLDCIIDEIQTASTLAAETRNTLHSARSNHPWCAGKTFEDRKTTVLFATAGRAVPSHLRHAVEKLQEKEL